MYEPGFLNKKIVIVLPGEYVTDKWGTHREEGEHITRWANVTGVKGVKTLRAGALDAYQTLMIRLNYEKRFTRECKVIYDGRTYKIDSDLPTPEELELQWTCTEIVK